MPKGYKKCSRCGEFKTWGAFNYGRPGKGAKGGMGLLRSACRVCEKTNKGNLLDIRLPMQIRWEEEEKLK